MRGNENKTNHQQKHRIKRVIIQMTKSLYFHAYRIVFFSVFAGAVKKKLPVAFLPYFVYFG